MREVLAHALSGPVSLMEDDYRERDVDRLHALACAQLSSVRKASHLASLGVAYIGLKYANREDELPRCIAALERCLAWDRPTPGWRIRTRVAHWAIMETVIDMCPTCQGRGEIPAQDGLDGAQRMKTCPECAGHGKRRYSNAERIYGLQIEPGELAKVERTLGAAISYLAEAEHEAIRGAKRLLDRW